MNNFKRNAIIMAAGTSSRFVPLSSEWPKGLLIVKGEVLIERQIRQLHEAGIDDITIVVGYKAEMFEYLQKKFGVSIVMNEDYYRYNNTSSLMRVLDELGNTYICSSDNYFSCNVFKEIPTCSYYSALYADGYTNEYCLTLDANDNITKVTVGGQDAWYMVGHVYFSKDFSEVFKNLLVSKYENEETKQGYWEDVYIRYINELPKMQVHRYKSHDIEEFDTIDELRQFDKSYISNTRSSVVKEIAEKMNCKESELCQFSKIKHEGDYLLFTFQKGLEAYCYNEQDNSIKKI